MYSPVLYHHACHPKNRGRLEGANANGSSCFKECGDHFHLFLKIEDGRILDASYQSQACGPVTALGSLATEVLRGQTVEQALQLDAFYWNSLAGGLPPAKRHAILLLIDSLHDAISQFKNSEE